MNFLWIDVETTGLYADKHDVVQLACIPVINGVRQKPFNEFCQPVNWDAVEDGAIRVHGITREMMRASQPPAELLDKLIKYLKSFNTRFVIAGYNVGFDKKFTASFFTKHNVSSHFFDLFELNIHDTYARAKEVKSQLPTENLKLETLANYYKVEIKAHDALSDIDATIEVDRQIGILLGEENQVAEQTNPGDFETNCMFPEPAQLHLHSNYGMLEAVASPGDWSDWCKENNAPGFSVCDPGVGLSLYEMVPTGKEGDPIKIPGAALFLGLEGSDKVYSLNAWATQTRGYKNLMKLVSLGHDRLRDIDGVEVPVISKDELSEYMDGILFGTADAYGGLGQHLEEGDIEKANWAFNKLVEILDKQLVVEFNPISITYKFSKKGGFQKIKRNGFIPDGDLNRAFCKWSSGMVDKYDLLAVPTCGAHFINPGDKLVHDCLAKDSYESGRCFSESYQIRNAMEMYCGLKTHLGEWLTEAKFGEWIKTTHEIAEEAKGIEVESNFIMPKIDIPQHIQDQTDDYDMQTFYYLVELCKKHGRWNDSPEYKARFKKEIDVIMKNSQLNFIPYFLLYEDLCTYARSKGILGGIGRGSAGGSIVSYYLKIIHIDPIETDLPFERFLSHARINAMSFPDIDNDFGNRTPIIEYIAEKYGLGFAQIGTVQRMKVKNAIKLAAAALRGRARNDREIDEVCKTIPDSPQGLDEKKFLYGYTDKEGEEHGGIVDDNKLLANFFEYYPDIKNMVDRIIGLPRSYGRHASAYVIATLDLAHNRCPTMIMTDKEGQDIRVTQFEAWMVEKRGLVKADILGVTTIQAISDCVDLIRERAGKNFLEEDENGVALVYRLPEDEGVYADFYNKKTDSSFQFSTGLIKGYIQQFAPLKREDLSDLTALCRPGALDAPMVNDELTEEDGVSAAQYYMDVRNGKRNLSWIHPDLEPFTTNGAFVYQEQVMAFLVACGYTLEESDRIRGAIAKKKLEVMKEAFEKIRNAAKEWGWREDQAEATCKQIEAFARYSFNRSHSRCYAELGYITMWFKHHYPLEWWAATLNMTNDGKASTAAEKKLRFYMTLLSDVVKPPSLKKPSNKFQIFGENIVAPLSVLKKCGAKAVEELASKGPFSTIEDYITKVNHSKVNIGVFSAIIKGRAIDDFLDPEQPYREARQDLMNTYVKMRKCRDFTDDLKDTSPLNMFMMERDTNKCFTKTLLDYPGIEPILTGHWPGLKRTGRKGIPFTFGETPVLGGVGVAEKLLKKGVDKEVGMILLYESSKHKKIKSKKNGKEYELVEVTLSDGFGSIVCTMWGAEKALSWPVNSLVYIRGTLRAGFKMPVSITANEIDRIKESL